MLLISVFMEYGKICPDRTVLVKVEHDIFAPILEDHARKRPKCIPEPSVLAPLMSEKLLLLAGDKYVCIYSTSYILGKRLNTTVFGCTESAKLVWP